MTGGQGIRMIPQDSSLSESTGGVAVDQEGKDWKRNGLGNGRGARTVFDISQQSC